MERRHFLRTMGIALAAGLAGCTGNGDGDGDDETPTNENGTDDDEMDDETPTGENGMDDETPTDGKTSAEISGAQLIISNVNVSAWEVTEDETGSVAETGAENPTMTFEVGQRYAVTNDGWSSHPFAILANDDRPLLSQSEDGAFETDSDVGWVDEETEFSFTFTQDLADRAASYRCTVHPAMKGDVESA